MPTIRTLTNAASSQAATKIIERDPIMVLIDDRTERLLRPFYCQKCGYCVCEIFGDIQMLIPGIPDRVEIGSTNASIAVNCRGFWYSKPGEKVKCDAKYIF